MAELTQECIEDVLWISGNVDRSMDRDLGESVEDYAKHLQGAAPVLDMSGVGYFATSAAKSLIMAAQDIQSKGTKLKVRASPPVMQTLHMLGAQSWLEIEACQKGHAKPGEGSKAKLAAARQKTSASKLTPAKKKDETTHQGSLASYAPKIHRIKPEEGAAHSPKAKEAGGASSTGKPGKLPAGSFRSPAPKAAPEDAALERAHQRKGQPLLPEDEELPEKWAIIKRMKVLNTYTFHMAGGQEVTAKALERVAGPWVLVEARGTRRWINVLEAVFIDVL